MSKQVPVWTMSLEETELDDGQIALLADVDGTTISAVVSPLDYYDAVASLREQRAALRK